MIAEINPHYFYTGAHFRLVNRLNPEFGAGIFSITETNVNMSLPVCAELVTGGETDMQRAAIGLEREAVLLITTMERAAGIIIIIEVIMV